MPYELLVTKRLEKALNKLPSEIRNLIIDETIKLKDEPNLGEQLKGNLRGFRSLHIKINNVKYRVVYEIIESQNLIYIHAVGTRNNFYTRLGRLGLKAT